MSGVAIITGSGRGIGAATAKLAAKRGYAACVNYLNNEERADEVVAEIRAGGGRAILVQADTANEAEVVKLFERVDFEPGPVTALVNNAGITGSAGRLDSFDAGTIRLVNQAGGGWSSDCCRRYSLRFMSRYSPCSISCNWRG